MDFSRRHGIPTQGKPGFVGPLPGNDGNIAPVEAWPEQVTQTPDWYKDAKFGIFLHWGLYSLPAWAVNRPIWPVPTELAYAWHAYAEWYGNTVRIDGSPTKEFHRQRFGEGTSYEDLADLWQPNEFNANTLVEDIASFGAKYVVPTTKHHDGFCLYNTKTTPFNAVQRGPRRDLIGEIAEAVQTYNDKQAQQVELSTEETNSVQQARQAELSTEATNSPRATHAAPRSSQPMRFGIYFSGAHDWHVSDHPPITSDVELFTHRRNDEAFAEYSYNQVTEIINQYQPSILWNDIDWPLSGKTVSSYGLPTLFKEYFARIPDGVINDRWGLPYRGFVTREYMDVTDAQQEHWEATRGIGLSFGHNTNETSVLMQGNDIIAYIVETVAKNGNVLLNIGLDAQGAIPPLQRKPLEEVGEWMRHFDEGIYNTRPCEPYVLQTEYGTYCFTQHRPTTSNQDNSNTAASQRYVFLPVTQTNKSSTVTITPIVPYLTSRSSWIGIPNAPIVKEQATEQGILAVPEPLQHFPIVGIAI